jgi:tetratricopeptide (TPR) repeat protein
MDALRRYQSLRPADRNPLDSMGDVNLLHGRLREAENFYLDAAKKDPSFAAGAEFFKAAMARLMTGDLPGADALAQKYAEVRHRIEGPAGGSFDAEWLWISGRRQAACERLGQFARASETASLRDVAARAWAELAIWNLMLGDRTAADAAVGKAMSLATPKSANVAMLARFLAEPSAGAAEWQERIDRLFPGPDPGNLKELGLAYALLLSKQFQDALPVLERVNARTNAAAEESVPILLAWALLETGRTADAEPLLKWNPIPPPNGVNPFASFFFPRIYYLRGLAAEKSGRPDAARSDYALFLKLSGSTPLMWGEEKKAAAR